MRPHARRQTLSQNLPACQEGLALPDEETPLRWRACHLSVCASESHCILLHASACECTDFLSVLLNEVAHMTAWYVSALVL